MATHRKIDPVSLDSRTPAKGFSNESATTNHVGSVPVSGLKSWYRRPRNLAVFIVALVAVTVAVFVVINRDTGRSGSGSATTQAGSGPNKNLAEYFAASGITQTPVRPGDSGVPFVEIPTPPGWSNAGPDIKPGVYAELLYDEATNPEDVPVVEILLSRLDGAVDPAQVLEYAPGELKNLPDYRSVSEPMTSQLSGFDAVQLAGLYTKDREDRLIAQKTVVIPSPNGLFVLQMNADAPTADAPALQLATVVIDEQAKITP